MALFNTEGLNNELNIGNRVRIKENNKEGFIMGQEENYYLVLIDAVIERYEAEKLKKLGYTNLIEFCGIIDWKGKIER